MYLPWSAEPVPLDDRHIYRRAPVDEAVYRQLAGYGREGQAVFVSEVGYGSFPDIAANVERFRREGNPKTPPYRYHVELLESLREVMEKHRLGEVFPDVTSLCMASQEVQGPLYLAVRVSPATRRSRRPRRCRGREAVGDRLLNLAATTGFTDSCIVMNHPDKE